MEEILRVIQLYYFAEYVCVKIGTRSEDGYQPAVNGSDNEDCLPHSTDYAPEDWRINLTELMRTVQLYNAGGYTYCAHTNTDSEDGYCPGAPTP